MKKYINPEMKILNIDTKDICNSSMIFTEIFDIGLDPYAKDEENW